MICPVCKQNNRSPKKYCFFCGTLLPLEEKQNEPSSSGSKAIATSTAWPLDPTPAIPSGSTLSPSAKIPPPRQQGHAPSQPTTTALRDFVGQVSDLEKRIESHTQFGVQIRYRQHTLGIWTFRVSRRDAHGYVLPPAIPVEIRGFSFQGNVRDGDLVRIPYAWKTGQVVHAHIFYNLSTASTVQISQKDYSVTKAAKISGVLRGVFCSTIAFFVLRISNSIPFISPFIVQIICVGFMAIGMIIVLFSLFGSGNPAAVKFSSILQSSIRIIMAFLLLQFSNAIPIISPTIVQIIGVVIIASNIIIVLSSLFGLDSSQR